METLISILIAIIGGLGFLVLRKSKQNTQLKADKSLADQKNDSKITDEKIKDAQDEINKLVKEMDKPVSDSEEFWKDYKGDE